jgi:hypothetical protein
MSNMDRQREGQSTGRTTGASGQQAEQQQNRTIEGQESQPGKVWQESDQGQYTDKSQYTGQGDTRVGGSDPGKGPTGEGGLRGGFDEPKEQPENEPIDESQWQGNRFGQGGFGNQGGSNG